MRGGRPDGTTFACIKVGGDDLPLVEPLCWPVHGWWLISDRLLVATFEVETEDNNHYAFGAYPVLYSTPRRMAADQGIHPATIDAWEATGVELDNEQPMSPTGCLYVYLDPLRNELAIDLGIDDIPPEMERESYEAAVITLLAMTVAANLMSADPAIVETTSRPRRLVSKQRRRYGFASEHTTTINLPGLRYESGRWSAKTGAGVAWHMVRGHWRTLKHPKYKEQRRVWVRPHSKGSADLGTVSHNYTIDRRSA